MLDHKPGSVRMVFKDSRKWQIGPPKTEIHRRAFSAFDELSQIVLRPEPGQDAVAFPASGNDFFASQIGRKIPAMLLCKFFDAPVKAIVVPTEGKQHASL